MLSDWRGARAAAAVRRTCKPTWRFPPTAATGTRGAHDSPDFPVEVVAHREAPLLLLAVEAGHLDLLVTKEGQERDLVAPADPLWRTISDARAQPAETVLQGRVVHEILCATG